MSLDKALMQRSGSKCELCAVEENLDTYLMPSGLVGVPDEAIVTCSACKSQIEDPSTLDANHWRCLNDSMWSEVPAVQVLAWRLLNQLKDEGWPQDLIDMMYFDEYTLAWAKAYLVNLGGSGHVDANGVILQTGDTVVLTQTLNVKGSSAAAKRGYAVRNISLVHDNPEQIEGKVEGQQIVILTKYVKKK